MAKIEETWYVLLSLPELEFLDAALTDELERAGAAGARADRVVALRGKVRSAVDTARSWATPISELINTPSRGELPDA